LRVQTPAHPTQSALDYCQTNLTDAKPCASNGKMCRRRVRKLTTGTIFHCRIKTLYPGEGIKSDRNCKAADARKLDPIADRMDERNTFA